jgi:heme-degrading monooxygenase HmoA
MDLLQPAETPEPPYWAVIFTSTRHDPRAAEAGYDDTALRMLELAHRQPGFLGVETVEGGLGITISYWQDEESIRGWKAEAEHLVAQQRGRAEWYERFELRVARVERAYGFTRATPAGRDGAR